MTGKGSSNPVPVITSSPAASKYPAAGSQSVLKQRRPGGSTAVLPAGEKGSVDGVVGRRTAKGIALDGNDDDDDDDNIMPWTKRNTWIVYAVASGACAAFNGVFAKLTTDNLTAHIAQGISGALGLEGIDGFLEIIVRSAFFGLNILFNIIMWTLFTKALAKGNSTTQVSIMNTSTNFMISALLGLAIFAESLPPLWWAGATLLVAGNVILGRKEVSPEEDTPNDSIVSAESGVEAAEQGHGEITLPGIRDEEVDEDVPLLGDLDSSSRNR
ncbi:hypothetical protein RRF57_000651 [Xylaria bambusicola]|uniref:EamA domain-containing protein n=1 Tax=Xylaria bambusicola TaxID=326684 RepID=A0AAN7YUC6_9PEZI